MLLGGFSQLVVVLWGIVCSVSSGSRYRDSSVVIDGCGENGSFPGELFFQQEVGQQGWESLEEGRAVGDRLGDSQGGEKSALRQRVGLGGGVLVQGQELE